MTTSHPTTRRNETEKRLLAQHHLSLDARLEQLVARAQGGDPTDLRAEWTAFERELLSHFELEEAEILPDFAACDPGEAHALLDEHAAFRSALLDIGLTLDLHCLRAEVVEDFARRLKAHAAREDAALYAWAQRHVSPATWHGIENKLKAPGIGAKLTRLANSFM